MKILKLIIKLCTFFPVYIGNVFILFYLFFLRLTMRLLCLDSGAFQINGMQFTSQYNIIFYLLLVLQHSDV